MLQNDLLFAQSLPLLYRLVSPIELLLSFLLPLSQRRLFDFQAVTFTILFQAPELAGQSSSPQLTFTILSVSYWFLKNDHFGAHINDLGQKTIHIRTASSKINMSLKVLAP